MVLTGRATLGQTTSLQDIIDSATAAANDSSFRADGTGVYDKTVPLQSDWISDMSNFHWKFGVDETVAGFDAAKLKAFLGFRLKFLQEELDEAKEAAGSGDVARAEDIVDAMIDLCVVAIGTLNAFQVDADEAWTRVLVANMAKQVGIKPERPNPLGLPDLIKPAGWTAPSHADNVGLFSKVFA